MGFEKFPTGPDQEIPQSSESCDTVENSLDKEKDFSMFLGEGFTNEYFADKTNTFPKQLLYDEWNAFLRSDSDQTLHARTIEQGILETVVSKIGNSANAPLMFPVFIQGLQNYYKEANIPDDHVTPERMQTFYESISSAGSDT